MLRRTRKPSPNDLFTTTEAAAEATRLGVPTSRHAMRMLALTGRIRAVPVGTRQVAIPRDAIERYVRNQLGPHGRAAA